MERKAPSDRKPGQASGSPASGDSDVTLVRGAVTCLRQRDARGAAGLPRSTLSNPATTSRRNGPPRLPRLASLGAPGQFTSGSPAASPAAPSGRGATRRAGRDPPPLTQRHGPRLPQAAAAGGAAALPAALTLGCTEGGQTFSLINIPPGYRGDGSWPRPRQAQLPAGGGCGAAALPADTPRMGWTGPGRARPRAPPSCQWRCRAAPDVSAGSACTWARGRGARRRAGGGSGAGSGGGAARRRGLSRSPALSASRRSSTAELGSALRPFHRASYRRRERGRNRCRAAAPRESPPCRDRSR